MRLAGEDDLDRPPRVYQQPAQAIDLTEDQVGPLIGGKPAGKANGESHRIQQRSRANHLRRFLQLAGKASPGVLPNEVSQRPLLSQVGFPELGMIERQHLIPEARLLQPFSPVGAQMFVQDCHDRTRHPGGEMDTVGDVGDRNRLERPVGREIRPQVASDLSVPPRHTVYPGRESHSHSRHMELIAMAGVSPKAEQLLPAYAHLVPDRSGAGLELVGGERIVSRWHRGVSGEYTLRPNLLYRLIQRRTGNDQLAQPLDEHESRVPLVGMPHPGIDTDSPKHTNTAHTQDPLLAYPELGPAGVEFVHQP